MSRALKIGFTCAIECLQKENNQIPEAIIIGTGKGCLSETEQFLHSIKQYNETALNATHFIHSTYNQLNGMIALQKKINSYNITYVHRGFSFEHCLMDASLLFEEGEINSALVGSFDEMTLEHFNVKKQWAYWKNEKINSLDLLSSESKGSISGEGAAFFLLSKHKPAHRTVAINYISTLYAPTENDIEQELECLLKTCDLNHDDIDIVLSGENGDANYKESYLFFEKLFPHTQFLFFKQLCGEYDTATSFATWMAKRMLELQVIPDYMRHPNDTKQWGERAIKHILIYNNYFHLNQSMILLSITI
jgi:3-oxoacyl-(acyl-carrier-protein) synthase